MLKKARAKVLTVLLALMILLPLATIVMPNALNPSLVSAASSAAITLDVPDGYAGDYVTVNGSGFNPAKDITFTWGANNFASLGFISGMPMFQRPSIYAASGVRTDALGNFVVQLQVPKLTSGTYTITASDTENSASASFTIKSLIKLRNQYAYETHGSVATPQDYTSSANYIDLFLAEGFVYDRLCLQLSGFGRGETVEVMMGTTKLGDFIVGSTGTTEGYLFQTSAARVPNIPGVAYTVTATGTVSAIIASTTFTIKPELFLAIPPPVLPPPAGLSLGESWVYYQWPETMGLGWYTSIGTTVDSPFVFEATGLTGDSISSVSIVYSGISAIACTVSGTLTLQVGTGSTQGINVDTAPYTAPRSSNSPFGANSPVAKTPTALTGGKIINVTITTAGTGAASFTFTNQLFSSTPSTSDTAGNLVCVEGDSTIASDGLSLSGIVGDTNKLVVSGLQASASNLYTTIVYSSGSTVQETDVDALGGWGLSLYDQDVTPVSFYDAVANSMWDIEETVYVDNDNSGTVTVADSRVTLLTLAGSTFLPWSTVVGGDPDIGRALIEFAKSTRPGLYWAGWPFRWVYLDKSADATVSKGDTRISTVFPGPWTYENSDLNGFIASTWTIPQYPGARTHDVGLWNLGVGAFGVKAGNTVTMQIMPSLYLTNTPRYQSTYYVTEGSSVVIYGYGFFGAEPLTISVGGKYVTTLTPNSYGNLWSTWITMPALAGGEQTITALGMFTAENTASTNVVYTPALSISPTSGYNLNPVTSIAVTGIGFEAGTYQIIFDGAWTSEAVTASFTVSDTGATAGQINIAFDLPEGVEGVHIVDVVNASEPTKSAFYGASYFTTGAGYRSGVSTTYPYPTDSEFPRVTIYPSLQTTPTSTTVGTSVTVTGKGLQPSTTYYIWYDPRGTSTSQAALMTTTPTTVTTDAEGTLTSSSFQVPKSSGGTRRVWVSTSMTHIDTDPVFGGTVSVSIWIQPSLVSTPSSGPVGTTISVTLSGLGTGSQYQLWMYKPEQATTDIWGAIEIPQTAMPLATVTGATYGDATETVSFTVPATAEVGAVYAIDLSSFGSRTSVLPTPSFFTVGNIATTITLSLTPTTVTQGKNVTINGFIEPAMSVDITLSITNPKGETTDRTVTSTSSGTFTDTFKPDKAGTWQVIAEWDGDATFAGYTSLAATVTAEPVDMTWAYMLAGLIVGIVALASGLILTLYYMRKKPTA